MFCRYIRKTLRITNSIKCCKSTIAWNIPKYPEFNINFLCDPNNERQIQENILRRKGVGNIKLANELKKQIEKIEVDAKENEELQTQFYEELSQIPNQTHPDIVSYGDELKIIKVVNNKKLFTFKCLEFSDIVKRLNMVRTEQLGNVCGNRSYYILGELAELEQALINYFIDELIKSGFEVISVPDILPRDIIERCGMNTRGERNQVIIYYTFYNLYVGSYTYKNI